MYKRQDLGSILITASSGVGPFMYSIDGGANFQEENLFTGLAGGDYQVVVVDADGNCNYQELVTVSLVSDINDVLNNELEVVVRPNPTDGFFNVDVHGYGGSENWLKFQILDTSGKLVQERKISKYNDIFTTQISLLAYPDGIYFFRLVGEDINGLTKIIKQ